MKNSIIFVLGIVLLLCVGCINLDINQNSDNNTNILEDDENGATLNPSFSVLYPSGSSKIETAKETADVEVLLQTNDITLKTPSLTNVNGEGHFVFILDESSATAIQTSYTFEDVELGDHTLVIEFVNNDGTSYNPQLKETIQFTVVLQEGVVLGPKEYTVTLENNEFNPKNLNIKINDIVIFTNEDPFPHSITISKISKTKGVNSNPLSTGESFSYAFEEEGVFEFVSMTIPTIKGTVVVSK